ncbi:MAG: hypothetical protein HQL32_04150 [Planctomycetes bacterium]|nr:hypothetical protein [Planctomycetota bacterium]
MTIRKQLTCTGTFLFLTLLAEASSISGELSYEKVVYSRPYSNQTQEVTKIVAIPKATVVAKNTDGDIVGETQTNNKGEFVIEIDSADEAILFVLTENNHSKVGGSQRGKLIEKVHAYPLGKQKIPSHNVDATIKGELANAFNVFAQLVKAKRWMNKNNIKTDAPLNAVWPASSTRFEPGNGIIFIQGTDSDPDGYDDDIIFHEFGHWLVENISTDHSMGGYHTINSQCDLRLSWSEGLAHYISSLVRNDPTHIDSLGTKTGKSSDVSFFDISKPKPAGWGSDVEIAVSSVLWNISLTSEGKKKVLETLQELPNHASNSPSQQATLDLFFEVWSGSPTGEELKEQTQSRNMAYQADQQGQQNISKSTHISDPSNAQFHDLTFYPRGDKDYFSFTAEAGKSYDIETGYCKNGALTQLKIYKAGSQELVTSNAQRAGVNSNMSSYIFLQAEENQEYIVEVSRFNSLSKNYGPGASAGYNLTAGDYGSYSFSISQTQSDSSNPNRTSFNDFEPSNNEVSVFTNRTQSGGGGCLLK